MLGYPPRRPWTPIHHQDDMKHVFLNAWGSQPKNSICHYEPGKDCPTHSIWHYVFFLEARFSQSTPPKTTSETHPTSLQDRNLVHLNWFVSKKTVFICLSPRWTCFYHIYIYRVIGSHNSTYRVKITPSEMHWFSTIWPFIGGPIVTPSSQKPSRKYSFLAGIKRPVPKMVIGTIGTFARFAMDTGPRLNFLGVWLLFHVWKKNVREKIVKKFGRLFKNHLESRWRWFIIAPY